MRKVYIIFGITDRYCLEYDVFGVFDTYNAAEDFMIRLARKSFDECEIQQGDRECIYDKDGRLSYIVDNYETRVELMLREKEIMGEFDGERENV